MGIRRSAATWPVSGLRTENLGSIAQAPVA
jgi:hypothetical protein